MFSALALATSLRCNDWCRFCDFGVKQPAPYMTASEAAKYLQAVEPLPTSVLARQVEILGGEPFLHFSDLRDIVQCASGYRFRTEVVTNGFWAIDYDETERLLDDLVRAGLDELTLAVDSYHRKFISLANIELVMAGMRRRGREVNIIYRVARADDLDQALLRSDLVNSGITTITVVPWAPLAGSDPRVDGQFFLERVGSSALGCRGLFRLVVLPGGDVAPCVVGAFKGLHRIGNLLDSSGPEILSRVQDDPLWPYLRECGPMQLATFLGSELGRLPDGDGCVLCYRVFSDPGLTAAVRGGFTAGALTLRSSASVIPGAEARAAAPSRA